MNDTERDKLAEIAKRLRTLGKNMYPYPGRFAGYAAEIEALLAEPEAPDSRAGRIGGHMTLEQKLIRLAKLGCYPVVARRGRLWRAHINACGNQWDEHDTPSLALDAAIHQWEHDGRPMDGIAAPDTTPPGVNPQTGGKR